MNNNDFIVYEDKRSRVMNGEEVFNKIKKIDIDYSQENFIVFFLNVKNRIIQEENLFKGGLSACLVCPNTIFKKALILDSDRIILAHNHPSKDLTASNEDIQVFESLKEMGNILDIKVLDSIIFNKGGYFSQIE